MTDDLEAEVEKLQRKIGQAVAERDSWKGKSVEHFRMGTILVQALEKQLGALLQSGNPKI